MRRREKDALLALLVATDFKNCCEHRSNIGTLCSHTKKRMEEKDVVMVIKFTYKFFINLMKLLVMLHKIEFITLLFFF